MLLDLWEIPLRCGVFGGSFDPVHLGHLILADTALECAQLDRVLFMPVSTSPLKPDGPTASNRQRVEMLQLALGGNTALELSTLELDREGVSYTVDTLEALRKERPDDEWFLIVGADSLEDFGRWKNIERICELAIPLVGARRGSSADLDQLSEYVSPDRLAEIRQYAFEFPAIEISSTRIRRRVADGRSIRYRLPRGVEQYIHNAKLYL
ncbi:MAG: nicotinate-nucleotide adenylyltransferase [Pirellulaceae bacterium]